jgi:hypothetical protein
MGNRQAYRKRFFNEHPKCCFCGGGNSATEIEHMPPRIMFLGKNRPKGFEFPICRDCNSVSSKSELVAAFFARSRLDLDENDLSLEMKSIMRGIVENCPETVEEILNGNQGLRHRQKRLREKVNIDFELLKLGRTTENHIKIFNGKMAIAAYYRHAGKPLSVNGGVLTKVSSMVDAIEGTLPEIDIDMSEFQTIRQGEWNVASQFLYRQAFTENNDGAVFQFLYHENFLATSFVFSDRSKSKIDASHWMIPGKINAVSEKLSNPYSKYSYSYVLAT